MAIKNLSGKVSQSDINRVKDIKNPPEYEPGFEGGSSGDGFDDFFGGDDGFSFDDFDSSGFGADNNSSGGNSGGFGSPAGSTPGGFGSPVGSTPGGFGSPAGSTPGGFAGSTPGGFAGSTPGGFAGSTPGGFGQPNGSLFPSPFGQPQQQMQQPQKPDLMDKAFDAAGAASMSFGKILIEFVKSIKQRNADDFGYLSRNLILSGAACAATGLVIGIIGTLNKVGYISFGGFPAHFLGAGILTVGTGLAGLGFSAIKIAQSTSEGHISVQELPDVADEIEDDATEDYEQNVGDILDDLFGDDFGSDGGDDWFSDDNSTSTEPVEEDEPDFGSTPVEKVNFNNEVDKIAENQYLSREVLFNTFKPFFPCNTPTFADRKDIDPDSEDFTTLETMALKALSYVLKCELEDVNSHLESAVDTYFSYELKMARVRGLKNTEEIAREIEVIFRENSYDTSVNATVDIENDFYKIVVTKGESAVVTFGDIFRQKYTCDFFLDTGNKLPIITGITELGKVILDDAKVFDTMMIAGKPRSGKSWYVFSILMALAMFNTPEDVQFIVVDPKESNLFNTFALMPHVAGLHNDDNVLDVMADIIENEAPRRKALLASNKCDDIWALRKKGIKVPILYLVMDEYITIRNNLGAMDKELDNKLQVIISQLPSLGIRLLFVPHRATGVVNKTNRTMLQYTASVKGDVEDVKDTLGINKWNRALTKPGDIAIKASTMQNAMYIRGAALTTSDEENAELMRNVAKAFYKMGVDMPDMSTMKIAVNRDEEFIRKELQEDGKRIQYNNFADDLDTI